LDLKWFTTAVNWRPPATGSNACTMAGRSITSASIADAGPTGVTIAGR
jgi:hypothetical protein